MRSYNKILICILVAVLLIPLGFETRVRRTAVCLPKTSNAAEEKRACWISYIDMEQYLSDKKEAVFRAKVQAMYKKIKEAGLNTVIVHARAMGDAFYPSERFPFSAYMSKDRICPDYDPYAIMVEIAKKEGLKFEAWINPYRLSIGDETTNSFKQTAFYTRYQQMILEYTGENGTCLSLNPADPDAQKLVIDGVKEIMERYPVDGIHLDDYFYIDGMDDSLEADAKKQIVNQLIQNLYCTIKEENPDCTLGISPAGNLDYARSQGADIDTWLSEDGYVDYVMPQIYWTDQYRLGDNTVPMFSDRCRAWMQIHKNKNVKLYVGLALYRVGESSDQDLEWIQRQDNLAYQCKTAYAMGFEGFALFRYAFLEKEKCDTELANLRYFLEEYSGEPAAEISAQVAYAVHMQTFGWQTAKADGIVAGMTHLDKHMEAISIVLGTSVPEGDIKYKTEDEAGCGAWVKNGAAAGSTGKNIPLTGLYIKLEGKIAEKYDVSYRVYVKKHGWTKWTENGAYCGGGILEAVQVKISKKAH